MSLGKRLRRLRRNKDLTQVELSGLLKVKTTTLATWEQERSSPDIDTVVRIANFFGVSTDYLLGLTDIENPDKQRFYSGKELKLDHLELLEILADNDYIEFARTMKKADITPEMLEQLIILIQQLKTVPKSW